MKNVDSELTTLLQLYKENRYGEKFYAYLKKTIEDYPEALTKLFYEAILQIGDLSNNPFSKEFGYGVNPLVNEIAQNTWGDIARIRINQMIGQKCKKSINDFILLTDLIDENLPFDDIYMASYNSSNFASFKNYVLRIASYQFRDEISKICTFVYQGLPLFKKNENEKNQFLKISETNFDYIYIFMSGYYQNLKAVGCYPKWICGFHFNNFQLDIHKQFFDGFDGDDESLRIRRKAFRNAIGEEDIFPASQETYKFIPHKMASHGNHETKLMRIQKEVLKRFYGDQFNLNDSDTWTHQQVVVEWLKSKYRLSDREAKSIDIVTRPDQARGK